MPGFSNKAAEGLSARRAARSAHGLFGAGRPDDHGRTMALLTNLSPHPDNARTSLGDVSELEQSIRAQGVLQELVVTTSEAHLAAWPAHRDAIGEAEYVVICGHRRLAAAVRAGLTEIPIRIRPELSDNGRDLEVMLSENGQRNDLSALDEARSFARLQEEFGRTQEQICAAVGCSQSHVSKRLALLRLPGPLQAALQSDELTVRDAIALESKLKTDDDRLAAWTMVANGALGADDAVRPVSVSEAIAVRREQGAAAGRVAAARKRAQKEGLSLVDVSGDGQHWRLEDDDAVAQARAAGTLAALIDAAGTFCYVSTQPLPAEAAAAAPAPRTPPPAAPAAKAAPTAAPARTSAPAPRPTAENPAAEAAKAREDACRRIAARKPTAAEALRRISRCVVLQGATKTASLLAHQWLYASRVGPEDANPDRYFDAVVQAGGDLQVQLAHAAALAADELAARAAGDRWGPDTLAHVRRLMTEADYSPTPWEAARLQDAAQPA
ncbi:ParB/RepB/Spo0J family partition protein [Krasilnikovia sp. MM14-A1259]|uniref:ParB/RepB/Spo0J family partition protein n=1 Tax=Krasilnikovia sp. MM14-A1259 TaxID=3373539 RepID=UPI003802FF8E